ncbi:DNA-3-methyladenine glycosylase 2 [Candidatus Methylospira mobilis]|uniref:DNA-3-methyladenine glycosylase II n=1 Tax=Candidatus Methylospira mobilis TaxID=1808979 RepID=A0A5Q0BEN2_9GAMM|nr:AlkA N-terminal domain-containing protein [Candidatus Methylospira mobilis]QFY41592.1 DNA-3-methyladenine glycosylase 2 [Candidatus Methylospira mobilis]WNV05164.1 DNA-3-methyladenine glycosylase 2 [Candidatus Methylospira mobilis]
MSSSVLSCTLPLPANYRMTDILSFHGRDALAVSESVAANQMRKGILWHGSTACLTLRLLPLRAEIELSIDHTQTSLEVDELSALAVRMLGLNQPIDVFEESVGQHPQLGVLINNQSGLRVPVAPTAFEALSWAITGQQISVAAAISIRRKFIQLVGLQHFSGLYCYPDARHVSCMSASGLRQAGFSKSKAQTLLTVSQMAVSGGLELNNTQKEPPIEQIRQQLLKIHGIGPWTVNYALLRGYGWLDGSLHGDAAVRRGLQVLLNHVEEMGENQVRQWLENFAPWRALVAAHLWELVSRGG